jgi:hypothetical protein
MTTRNVARRSVAADLSNILDSPEVADLIEELQQTRLTGRPGYPLRSMVGMALAKSLYSLPTWTQTVALVREHAALAAVIAPDGDVPSVYACYRFTAKLRDHAALLEECIASVIRALKKRNPLLGWDVAIDASDMPAYANGKSRKYKDGPERTPEEYSDPDASWGHRSVGPALQFRDPAHDAAPTSAHAASRSSCSSLLPPILRISRIPRPLIPSRFSFNARDRRSSSGSITVSRGALPVVTDLPALSLALRANVGVQRQCCATCSTVQPSPSLTTRASSSASVSPTTTWPSARFR